MLMNKSYCQNALKKHFESCCHYSSILTQHYNKVHIIKNNLHKN